MTRAADARGRCSAARSGPSGSLVAANEPEDLLHAGRVVAAGEALLAPSITRRLIENFVEARRAAEQRDLARASVRPRPVPGGDAV